MKWIYSLCTLWSCRANHSYDFVSSSKYKPEHHETGIWHEIHAPKKIFEHSNPSPDSSPPEPETTGIYPRKWRHVKDTLVFLWSRSKCVSTSTTTTATNNNNNNTLKSTFMTGRFAIAYSEVWGFLWQDAISIVKWFPTFRGASSWIIKICAVQDDPKGSKTCVRTSDLTS